jgi:hypothetical protein
MFRSRFLFFILVIIAFPIMLLSCSSGGGSGSETAASSGVAAVFIKDAPTPEYDRIVLCMNKATLEPGSVTLFESDSCVEIDLLDHQDRPFLLTVKEIPTGTYNQIRLIADYVESTGGPCDDLDIKIPSGVIKVNPQGPIRVKPGDTLGFEIDIQVKRSLNLHEAGKSQKCIFDPVIIATVTNLEDMPPGNECPRIIDGTIDEIEHVDEEVKGFKLRLSHDAKSVVDIKVNENTTIFDESGNFTTPDALEVGQKVKVRGEVLKDASLRASVVAIGDLLKLYGTVNEVISDFEFIMKLSPGQVIVDEFIDVLVDNQTLILEDCNTEVGTDAIREGIGVRAIGKISDGDLIPAVLFLEEQKTYGTIVEMRSANGGFEIDFIPAGEEDFITLYLPDEAEVVLEGDGEIEKVFLAELVDCEPRKAHITLNEADAEVVDSVEVKDEVVDGIIKTTDSDLLTINLEGDPKTIIQVQKYATILKDGDLIPFKDLNPGDKIRVFGLEACSGDDVDFYGYVVLVVARLERGDEACSQGYWKNHLNSWGPTDYDPDDKYNEVFHVPYYKSLLAALESGGGGENALGRQAVAALLNAAHPGIDYFYSEYEVIDIVQDAYDTGEFERAKDLLEEHISPCPLD